ncbi:MAG: hypothetical protein HUU60_08230 [Armatimonadetes bacterium]|nr:hypothetical protein [Armatimonadota bacterium]
MRLIALTTLLAVMAGIATMQNERLTIRGQLTDGGRPANGTFDFRLRLFALKTGGEMLAESFKPGMRVANGQYSFDWPEEFSRYRPRGQWIEVAVRPSGSNQAYTALPDRIKPTILANSDGFTTRHEVVDKDGNIQIVETTTSKTGSGQTSGSISVSGRASGGVQTSGSASSQAGGAVAVGGMISSGMTVEAGEDALVGGTARIQFDSRKPQYVDPNKTYHVFLQSQDPDCNGLAVTETGTSGFTVVELGKGKSNGKFSYLIVGWPKSNHIQ